MTRTNLPNILHIPIIVSSDSDTEIESTIRFLKNGPGVVDVKPINDDRIINDTRHADFQIDVKFFNLPMFLKYIKKLF